MEIKLSLRNTTPKNSMRYNVSLPLINQKMGKTSNQFQPFQLIKSHSKIASAKKLKLDYQKYKKSINLKKEQINTLEKQCKNLKDKNKFNDEVVQEIILRNKKNFKKNENNKISIDAHWSTNPQNKKREEERVENYKEIKKNLENIKNEYIKGKNENKKIKDEILLLNDDIKDIENKVEQKKNDIINLKNKIKIEEKNKKLKEEILEKEKAENNKLNQDIKTYYEKQIDNNNNKLSEKNEIILKNIQLIVKLKSKLEELEQKVKK